jgi:hypothetical protein
MRGLRTLSLIGATVMAVAACSPAALAPGEIVPAFIAASQAATRTMHMEWQGTVATGGSVLPGDDATTTVTGVFDFNGPDYAGTMTTGLPGSSVSYARVGGLSFVNFSDSGWQRAEMEGSVPAELDPMIGLTAADVSYDDVQDLNGRQVHRVRVLDPLAAVRGFFGGQAAIGTPKLIPDGESEYLIYVEGAGIPVAAHVGLDLTADMPLDTDMPSLDYYIRWDYTFSQWAEPVTISPPAVVGDGFLGVPKGEPPGR